MYLQIYKNFVHPKGLEPPSSEPESNILSIKLRVRCFVGGQIYNGYANKIGFEKIYLFNASNNFVYLV